MSLVVLLLANLVPLVGALFFAWDAKLVMGLFWIENLIIGAFNFVKMLMKAWQNRSLKELFTSFFFLIHYGMFCMVHGSLLWTLLNLGDLPTFELLATSNPLSIIVNEGAVIFVGFIERYQPVIWLGILALTLSHLVNFIEHFILRGEIFKLGINDLMGRPYGQILVMHIGLILGAFVLEKFESPIWLLAIIVVFKIVVDVKQHERRRTKMQQAVVVET